VKFRIKILNGCWEISEKI